MASDGRRGKNVKNTAVVVSASIAFLAIATLSTSAGRQPAERDTLEWLDDYGHALALAKRSERPLLVEFRCAP